MTLLLCCYFLLLGIEMAWAGKEVDERPLRRYIAWGSKWSRCNGVTSEAATVLLAAGHRGRNQSIETSLCVLAFFCGSRRPKVRLSSRSFLLFKSINACCAVTSVRFEVFRDVTVLRSR
jgi:hypothetical protein